MATTSSSTSSLDLATLRSQKRLLGGALLWACLVLTIFALWTSYTVPQAAVVRVALGSLAALALVLGLWQLLRRLPPDPAQQTQILERNRHLMGVLFLVVGVPLALVGLWFFFTGGMPVFAEAVGLVLFGVIALGSGARLLSRPQTVSFQERFLQGVIANRLGVSMALLVLGGIFIIAGFWLRFGREVSEENPALDAPLWLGPILIGLLAVGVGSYLRLTPDLSVARARLFVLIGGGGFGLLLALFTLWQAWNWRTVFFGGLPAWRGEFAWRLWLCAYLEVAGLILMFACLGLARADIRVNPVLRRALYGYNAVLTGLLLLVFLIVLNIVIYVAFPFTFNWSEKGGLYALSTKSIDILESLDRQGKTAKVYLVMVRQSRLFEDLRQLLNNAQALTDRLEVEQINPDRDLEKHKELAKKYRELVPDQFSPGRGVLLVYAEGSLAEQHKFLTEEKLEEPNMMRRTRSFIGEKVLMEELQFFMTEKRKAKVYVLQGNGEVSLKPKGTFFRLESYKSMNEIAMARLVERLRKENIEVKGLSFGLAPAKADDDVLYLPDPGENKRKEIPDDAGVVVLAGPSQALPREVLDALERYVEGKGRLIVLLDLVTDRAYKDAVSTGLEEFLKKYNVQVTNQYVHSFGSIMQDRTGRLIPQYDRGPTQVYAAPNPESHSQLAKRFAGEAFLLNTARVVRPQSGPGKFQAHALLEVSPVARVQQFIWAEDPPALQDPGRHNVDIWNRRLVLKKASREPLPVAVTVHEGAEKPRMVVVGDAEFISDRYLIQPPGEIPPDVYYSFFASMIDWLSERPGLGIRPREPGIYTMKTDLKEGGGRMIVLPGMLMTLGVIGFGVGVWVVRRR